MIGSPLFKKMFDKTESILINVYKEKFRNPFKLHIIFLQQFHWCYILNSFQGIPCEGPNTVSFEKRKLDIIIIFYLDTLKFYKI